MSSVFFFPYQLVSLCGGERRVSDSFFSPSRFFVSIFGLGRAACSFPYPFHHQLPLLRSLLFHSHLGFSSSHFLFSSFSSVFLRWPFILFRLRPCCLQLSISISSSTSPVKQLCFPSRFRPCCTACSFDRLLFFFLHFLHH